MEPRLEFRNRRKAGKRATPPEDGGHILGWVGDGLGVPATPRVSAAQRKGRGLTPAN